MTTTVRPAVLTIILATVLAACSGVGASASPAVSAGPPPNLEGRTFLSTAVTVNGTPYALIAGTRVRISFTDGRLVASAGCNTMGGRYVIRDGLLEVSDLATTEIGCDADRHAQDQWLAGILGAKPAIRSSGNDLTLERAGSLITLADRVVEQPDLPLVGTVWTVVSIFAGDTVSNPPGGGIATLFFGPDARLQVNTGCNTGAGPYTVDLARRVITFGPIGVTKKACVGETDELEQAVLMAIDGAAAYSISANVMTMMNGQFGLQLDGGVAPAAR